MLVNESVEIRRGTDSIWIAGIDDPFDYKCDDLPGALANVPPQDFKVLMAHTPELYQSASDLGIDLYLCGHTHAGQIRLPLVGSLRNNADCPKEYAYGAWRHGSMQAYTSAGAGCSALPIRYNCPPEVTLIELRRGEKPMR
jgi:predicted MPP superfamily phosphohydrolase